MLNKKIKYHILLVSNLNINKDKIDDYISQVKKLNNIDIYVLTSEAHPNTYNMTVEKLLAKIKIHDSEFIRFLKNVM